MKTIKLSAILLVMSLFDTTGWAQNEVKTNSAEQKIMPAYLLAFVRVEDYKTYKSEYLDKATPIITRYGGVPIAVSESLLLLEGSLPKGKLVIVKFPSMNAAEDFYSDPEYQPLKKVREQVSESDAILFERGF